jgi:hypothetical protein
VRSVLGRFRPVNDRERAEMAGAESPINFHSEQTVGARQPHRRAPSRPLRDISAGALRCYHAAVHAAV